MAKIQIQNLTLTYQSPGKSYTALENLNLTVNEGEFVCIIGPSGCGKSSLLSVIEGLNKATSGKVLIDGKEITGPGKDRGIVFQHYSLFPWLTTVGNVVFAMKQNKIKGSKKELEETAKHYLTKVGLADAFEKYPAELSGGMQQRVAIARVLAANSSIFLMDEPFGAIDPKNRQELQELLGVLTREESKTVLFVTHDIDEAILLADRIIFIDKHSIQYFFI
jgi:NitT/TauT family transport system ATP-binding protein